MGKKSTIIFDFDGTIADTLSFVFEIVNELAKKYGMQPVTKEEFDMLRGKSPIEIIKIKKIPLYLIPLLVYQGQKMLTQDMAKVAFHQGMREVLLELQNRGYRLGILSSNSKTNIDIFLKENKLDVFDFVYCKRTLFGKHHSLKNILRAYNLKKEEVLYIGDEVRDIEACKKIGMEIVAVSWGYNTKEILAITKPEYLIYKPEELLNCLLT